MASGEEGGEKSSWWGWNNLVKAAKEKVLFKNKKLLNFVFISISHICFSDNGNVGNC